MRCGNNRMLSVFVLVAALAGCAAPGGSPRDPIEPFNRAVFSFNETVDDALLQPVAKGYRAAIPDLVRAGVSNFFSNLEDVWIGANNVLQGKVADGVQDLARFVFNSTIGLLGILDVSTDLNLPKHNEDFGQTLGRWGADAGPYLVIPLFGSSSVRDGLGFMVDFKADIVGDIDHIPTRNTIFALRAIKTRANLLDIGKVAEDAALDKYRFQREAYFQRRQNLVYDGNPPRDSDSAALPDTGEQSDLSGPASLALVLSANESDATGTLVAAPVTTREIDQSAAN